MLPHFFISYIIFFYNIYEKLIMFRIILTKIAAGLLTTLGVSIVIFLGTNALPGDAAQIRLGQAATEDSLRALREELGLNLPFINNISGGCLIFYKGIWNIFGKW